MADYVTKIRTNQGDKQIDYSALANLPKFDAEWRAAHGVADAAVVEAKLKELQTLVNELSGSGDIDLTSYVTEDELTNSLSYYTPLGYLSEKYTLTEDLASELSNDFAPISVIRPATTSNIGFVKIGDGISVTSDGTISVEGGSGSGDVDLDNYVTKTELATELEDYLPASAFNIASKTSYGVVKVGDGLSVDSGTVSVDANSLPIATADSLGVVKAGTGIIWEIDGKISMGKFEDLSDLFISPYTLENFPESFLNLEGCWFVIRAEE